MGVCKCRKRTSLFCFDHKKAVCLDCVEDHAVCTVRTYREWLRDSSFAPQQCALCSAPLNNNGGHESASETIRLVCMHVLHKHCLDQHASTLPPTTTLTGFSCPNCQTALLAAPPVSASASASSVAASASSSSFDSGKSNSTLVERAFNSRLELNLLAHLERADWTQTEILQEALSRRRELTNANASGANQQQRDNNGHGSVAPSTSLSSSSVVAEKRSRKAVRDFGKPKTLASLASSSSPSASSMPKRRAQAYPDADEDKYRRRGIVNFCQTLGLLGAAKSASSLPTSSSSSSHNRPVLNFRRLVVIFALLSTLMTIAVLSFALSAVEEQDDID
jgi:hypothetical protein